MKRLLFIASALLAFTIAGDRAATGVASSADNGGPAPGTVIEANNVQGFTQLLNPGMLFAVNHGLKIKVSAPERVDWPQKYQQATEQHAAQVSLDQTDSLENYVAGLPFPLTQSEGGTVKKLTACVPQNYAGGFAHGERRQCFRSNSDGKST